MPQSLIFFVFIYLMSFMLVIGCDSWFLVWVGMEINMISFIAIMYNSSMTNIESCLKYFFIQSVGSGMFVGSFYMNFVLFSYLISIVMIYKIGGGIFFYWFVSVCEGIDWIPCFMLMSMQKIIPMFLLSMFLNVTIWFMTVFSMIAGVVGAFNEVKLSKLLAYSSVFHVGWIFVCMMMDMNLWMIYFMLYVFMVWGALMVFKNGDFLEVSDLMSSDKFFLLIMVMLNMGGMPPMLGFYMKWWVFLNMGGYSFMLIFMMVVLSVVMFYVYLRLVFYVFMGGKLVFLFMGSSGKEMKMELIEELFLLGVFMGPLVGVLLM